MRTRFAARRATEAEDLIRRCMESEGLAEGKKVFQGGWGVAIAGYPWKVANISLRFSEGSREVCMPLWEMQLVRAVFPYRRLTAGHAGT